MNQNLSRRVAAEFLGTAFLLATVVGSGIMGEKLASGNVAIALLANSIATGGALIALILTFAEISDAHFNPIVTLSQKINNAVSWREFIFYFLAQTFGAVVGVMIANLMFELPIVFLSQKTRSGTAQFLSEFVATFGLVAVISGCSRSSKFANFTPFAVAGYIVAAYWFTSSTSFANPSVTIARTLSDTFAGIRFQDAPLFILAQILGAVSATIVFNWLLKEKR
ncbi:MAG: aquaporin family protein [Pyrinomonadaceae bacterium]|nr:aquaporin family protein [Pyrinomonadaceae bacterium]